MAGIRELRGRIKSIGNIKQITRAMEMVATTKLRRFQDRAIASRPYTDEIIHLVQSLAELLGEDAADRPLFNEGEGEATALLLISSDRGLCGAYNSNLQRKLESWLAGRGEDAGPVHYYVVGRKAYQYLTKRGREVERFLVEPSLENMSYGSAAANARLLTTAFLSGEYKDVQVMYTAFESMVSYVPKRFQLLPLQFEESASQETKDASGAADILLEPDPESIFDAVVPKYVETRLFNAMLEALTSEFASRRVSMKNATDAATDMQGELKSQYNRLRQESITKELLDIVGGVEALR